MSKCVNTEGWKNAQEKARETRNKALSLRIEQYNKNPKVCEGCKAPITYKKRFNLFCSRSCSASMNNAKFPKRKSIKTPRFVSSKCSVYTMKCSVCAENYQTRNKESKYCSSWCFRESRDQLVREGKSGIVALKRYMIKTYGEKCMECGWNKVHPTTNKVPIELDHIDGNSKNNTVENVRLICPNCHSLSPNYKALNRGNGRAWRMKRYKEGKSY